MTQDEIIEMARLAKLISKHSNASPWAEGEEITEDVEAFAKLVAAKEREACAKTCEELTFSKAGPSHDALRQRLLCAEAIRARGEA